MKILHISDLHLTDDSQFDGRLAALIRKVRTTVRNSPIDVLALTGDVRNWNAGFGAPVKFAETLLNELDIRNVLIVPGNHDMDSCGAFLEFDQRKDCSLLGKNVDGKTITEQYNGFKTEFVEKIKSVAKKLGKSTGKTIDVYHSTKDHSVCCIKDSDGNEINFVLIDSVYAFNAEKIDDKTPLDKYPLCYNCTKLSKVFDDRVGDNTVAVMHAPLYLSCEKIRTGFANAESLAELEQHFAFGLAGHTHQRVDTSRYQLVGARKNGNSENYGFMTDDFGCAVYDIAVTDGKVRVAHRDNIEFNKEFDDFSTGISDDEINRIYKLSSETLKKHLFGRDLGLGENFPNKSATSAEKIVVNGQEFGKADINALFDTICKMKDNHREEIDEFDVPTDIIAQVIDIMNAKLIDAKTRYGAHMVIPVAIKGALGTGKSTFYNLLYWEMLLRQKRDFEYIPVLVDFATVGNCETLETIIEQAKAIKAETGKPIYLLIDGLDNCKVYNENAKKLWERISNALLGEECLLIFNINRHYKSFVTKKNENHRVAFGFIDSNKSSDYILYFKSASKMEERYRSDRIKYGTYGTAFTDVSSSANDEEAEDKAINNLIRAYFNLAKCDDDGKITKLKKLMNDCPELDLDFHLLHWAAKKEINDGDGRVYAKLRGLFSLDVDENRAATEEAAVEYMMGKDFLPAEQMLLLKSPTVINMMFAKRVVDIFAKDKDGAEIRNYITFDSERSSIPRWYFNTKLNRFIQLYLDSGLIDTQVVAANISRAIKEFSREVLENAGTPTVKVSYVALAQLIYVLRHTGADNVSDCSNLIAQMIKTKGQQKEGEYSRKLDVIKRTLDVSEIALPNKSVYAYLNDIIKSRSAMELNRCFTLFYYGDRDDLDLDDTFVNADGERKSGNDDTTEKIFKYYGAFTYLYFRVVRQLSSEAAYRADFELDLFTLCNIVQMRAQNLLVDKKIKANRRQYVYNTVSLVYELLDRYFDSGRTHELTHKFNDEKRKIYYYYRSIQNDFGHLLITHYDDLGRDDIVSERFKNGIDNDEHEFERKRLRNLVCLPFEIYNGNITLALVDRLDITKIDRAGWGADILLKRDCASDHSCSRNERGGNKDLRPVRAESVAEHSFSLMTLAMLLDMPREYGEDAQIHARRREEEHGKTRRQLVEMSFFHDVAESLYGDKRKGEDDYKLVQEMVKNTTLALCYLGTYSGFADLTDYAPLVSRCLYGRAEDDLLKRLFDNLDALQMGIKLIQYHNDGRYEINDLTGSRFAAIYKDLRERTESMTRDSILYNLKQEVLKELHTIIDNGQS